MSVEFCLLSDVCTLDGEKTLLKSDDYVASTTCLLAANKHLLY